MFNLKWLLKSRTFREYLKQSKYGFTFFGGVLVGVGLKDIINNNQGNNSNGGIANKEIKIGVKSHEIVHKYGLPATSTTLDYTNHLIQYDNSKKIPSWVAQHLNREKLTGNVERQSYHFKSDVNIPTAFQSSNDDYLHSGYTRGHMMPAAWVRRGFKRADAKLDRMSMEESFYLSNVVPQNSENNAGFWFRMEEYCRALTKRYTDVFVISGPLFLPDTISNHVQYKVIGKNQVAVPTHLFKVILVENKGKPKAVGAFIVPNSPIPFKDRLVDYQVNLTDLERASGFEFFPELNRNSVGNLCLIDGCKLIPKNTMDLMTISRAMKKAKTINELDEIWDNIQNNELKAKLLNNYWTAKMKLKNT